MTLRMVAAILSALAAARAAGLTPDQARLLDQTRITALNYSKALPNFLCTERIQRESDWGTGKMVPMDTLTVQVSYVDQRESYRVTAQNNHKSDRRLDSLAGATSQGEFGSLLRWIFEPSAQAAFDFERDSAIAGRPVSVFAYHVDFDHSRMELRALTRAASVPFHGLLSIDPETHLVLSITAEAEGPEGFPLRKSSVQIDYDWATIAGRSYLVPVRAQTAMTELYRTDPMSLAPRDRIYSNASCINCTAPKRREPKLIITQYRNQIEFASYREFTAKSTVTFK